ncbi:MAG TPA: flagellar hook-basal body complex protein FliE [Opitutaceae bacterium]|nr:flagellar hook-basal body complex protein FliE [Opitutaceae bacterium]
MSPLGSINPLSASPLTQIDTQLPKIGAGLPTTQGPAPTESFGQMLDGLVSNVEAKDVNAQDLTRQVLLGKNDQLHQSVIAMQEASVAFSMMIQVRNKLVESYQELMRMQV